MKVQGLYAEEIEAVFAAKQTTEDIGGEMPFVVTVIEDVEFLEMYAFKKWWTEAELRTAFGDMGADAMIRLMQDQIDDWEELE
jgi:hypothetical protein